MRFYYWVPHKLPLNQKILITKRDKDSSTHPLSKLLCAPVDQGASKTQPSATNRRVDQAWDRETITGHGASPAGVREGASVAGGKQLSVSFHSLTE